MDSTYLRIKGDLDGLQNYLATILPAKFTNVRSIDYSGTKYQVSLNRGLNESISLPLALILPDASVYTSFVGLNSEISYSTAVINVIRATEKLLENLAAGVFSANGAIQTSVQAYLEALNAQSSSGYQQVQQNIDDYISNFVEQQFYSAKYRDSQR
jgi:hypothetical protein